MVPDDLFRHVALGFATFSPDGELLAYMQGRPMNDLSQAEGIYGGVDGGKRSGDIWIMAVSGSESRNVTGGAKDRTGYWEPVWAEDSQHLAMLSIHSGVIHLAVWDRLSGRMRKFPKCNVDITQTDGPFRWINSKRLAVACLSPDSLMESSLMSAEKAAMNAWRRSWDEEFPTVNTLVSPWPSGDERELSDTLQIIDINLGLIAIVKGRVSSEIAVSPHEHLTAFFHSFVGLTAQIDTAAPLGFDDIKTSELVVIDENGKTVAGWIGNHRHFEGELRWSPTETELAALAGSGYSLSALPNRWLRCSFSTRECRPFEENTSLAPIQNVVWSQSGEPIVYASGDQVADRDRSERFDWWLLPAVGHPENLTHDLITPPTTLYREASNSSFFGEGNGSVWRIRLTSPHTEALISESDSDVALAWPHDGRYDHAYSALIVARKLSPQRTFEMLELPTATQIRLPSPEGNAYVEDGDSRTRAIYGVYDTTGDSLWVCGTANAPCKVLAKVNNFRAELATTRTSFFDYHTQDGAPATATLYYPVDYREGSRYPLVVDVYLGRTACSSDYAPLLTSHGYAVLCPAMPWATKGAEHSDSPGPGISPYRKLLNGVMPAVDHVIEMGVADANRLGLIGVSYGGYSVYGIITQTSRFKAAIAISGLSDLFLEYGTLSPISRYQKYGEAEILGGMAVEETGQANMWAPPWQDIGQYTRNSPIFSAERVQTPLMMIHGDMDTVPIQHAEQFFGALLRQRKPAELVTYWGDGHTIQGRANIKDMWTKIFSWFDTYLGRSN